jgi:hypothetical protein
MVSTVKASSRGSPFALAAKVTETNDRSERFRISDPITAATSAVTAAFAIGGPIVVAVKATQP